MFSSVLYRTVLPCTVLYCTILYYLKLVFTQTFSKEILMLIYNFISEIIRHIILVSATALLYYIILYRTDLFNHELARFASLINTICAFKIIIFLAKLFFLPPNAKMDFIHKNTFCLISLNKNRCIFRIYNTELHLDACLGCVCITLHLEAH